MAEKTLPTQSLGRATSPMYFGATGATPLARRLANGTLTSGDQFLVANDERTYLHVKNGATAANVVIDRSVTVDGGAVEARTEAVPPNQERIIRDFPRSVYGNTVKFAIDDVTNVSVAVLRHP